MQKGIEKGMEKGKKEALLMTAKNMINMGMSESDIAKATGLKNTDIKRLKSKNE